VYDRQSHKAEKRAALAWWDRELRRILEDVKQTADVVPLERDSRSRTVMPINDRIASQV
jgi:hypothetical protein